MFRCDYHNLSGNKDQCPSCNAEMERLRADRKRLLEASLDVIESLQEENELLKEQVQHLQEVNADLEARFSHELFLETRKLKDIVKPWLNHKHYCNFREIPRWQDCSCGLEEFLNDEDC